MQSLHRSGGNFRFYSMTVPTVRRHVVTKQHDQIRILLVRKVNDSLQFLIINEGPTSVNVSDQSDAQAAQFLGPVVDLNCALVNDETAGFDEETPDEAEENYNEANSQRDANSVLPRLTHLSV